MRSVPVVIAAAALLASGFAVAATVQYFDLPRGSERADVIAHTDRNLLVFPNLIINDIMGVVIRSAKSTAECCTYF